MAENNGTAHYEGHRSRLRDRFRRTKGEGFQDYEWLELLLTYAIPRRDVKPTSKRLLEKFGSLSTVLKAQPEELKDVDGIGEVTATFFPLLKLISARFLDEELRAGQTLENQEAVATFARTRLAGETTESFMVIYLDEGNRVLSSEVIEEGIINEVKIYPRKILKQTLDVDASRVILIHNHPSGVLEASRGDKKITQQIQKAARTLDIKVLDHLIVTDKGYFSFRKENLI